MSELSLSQSLSEKILQGDKRALARLLTRIENNDASAESILSELYANVGRAYRIGITGPPGAGKSTITSKLTRHLRQTGEKVAIIAVDPTSPFTGGALLGDRVRMSEVMLDEGVFIRSMATRGSLGGLAKKATEVADVLDAAGYTTIIFETVGVGQSELDVVHAADTTVVTLVPESGDAIQAMKAGLMEIADIFVMNKADRQDADKAVQALSASLELRQHSAQAWLPRVVKTVATMGQGIAELLQAINAHRAFLETDARLVERRRERQQNFVQSVVEEKWRQTFWTAQRIEELRKRVIQHESPYKIAEDLLQKNP
jgi:LAO/AO transport system kinase